jgi:N-acetylneuraminic acid mutarotase
MWKQINAFGEIPRGRRRPTLVEFNDNLYLFGGFGDGPFDDLLKFNTLTLTWTTIPSFGPKARAGHVAVRLGQRMIIHGGNDSNQGTPFSDFWSLDFITMEWKDVTPKYRSIRRQYHACDVWSNMMILHGGSDGMRNFNDLHTFSDQYELIKLIAWGDPPTERVSQSLFIFDDNLFVFGGLPDNGLVSDELHVYNFGTSTWKKLDGKLGPSPRCNASVQVVGRFAYLFGGYNDDMGLQGDFYVFSYEDFSWNEIKTYGKGPVRRTKHTMTLVDNTVFCFGGHGGGLHTDDLADLHSYTLSGMKGIKKSLTSHLRSGTFCDLLVYTNGSSW